MEAVTLLPLAPDQVPSGHARVHMGPWSVPAPVCHRPGEGRLYLPEEVFARFPVFPGQEVHLWQAGPPGCLHLGPLVGVMVEDSHRLLRGGEPDRRLQDLAAGARLAGVQVVFLSVHHLDLRSGAAVGCWPAGSGRWQCGIVPLPDVLFNRSTYPDRRERLMARSRRRTLRRSLEVPFVNPVAALGKWETYRALRFFPHTRHLVPETCRFGDPDTFAGMLARHGTLYLKADNGSHGDQVLLVQAPEQPGGPYRLRGRARGPGRGGSFATPQALFACLAEQLGGEDWVVQQGIPLVPVRGRIWDLRVVLQKDADGDWQVPLVMVRWAQPGSIVTNTSQGSDYLSFRQFQAEHWRPAPAWAAGLEDRVAEAARLAAAALEARYGLLGELGLDIGIDPDGRPWLFEANAKPYLDPGEGFYLPFCYARLLAARAWSARYGAVAGPLGDLLAGPDGGGSGPLPAD